MNSKYILLYRCNGVSKQIEYPKDKKEQAVNDYKNLTRRLDFVKLFSIDSDDPEIWYDLGKKVM